MMNHVFKNLLQVSFKTLHWFEIHVFHNRVLTTSIMLMTMYSECWQMVGRFPVIVVYLIADPLKEGIVGSSMANDVKQEMNEVNYSTLQLTVIEG